MIGIGRDADNDVQEGGSDKFLGGCSGLFRAASTRAAILWRIM